MKNNSTYRAKIISNNIVSFILFLFLKVLFLFSKRQRVSSSLLVVNFGLVGDALISSILMENEEKLKNYENITYVIYKEYVGLFEAYDGRIRVLGVDKHKFKFSLIYKYNFIKQLRKQNYKTAVNLTAARSISSDSLTMLAGAKSTLCLKLDTENIVKIGKNYFDELYTRIIKIESSNEYLKNVEAIRYLSKFNNINEIDFFNKNTFKKNNRIYLNSPLPKIVIAPFSSEANRDWPLNNYSNLIKQLQREYSIIILTSPLQVNRKKQILDLVGDTNIHLENELLRLAELPQVIMEADCFIGGDSGMTHLALKLNIPLVAIIGGGNHSRYFPYKESAKFRYLFYDLECFNCEWDCYQEEQYCITNVTVDQVLENAKLLLTKDNCN